MAEMYELPEIDLTKALSVGESRAGAGVARDGVAHEMQLLSVGVLFLELAPVVRCVYKTYLSKFEIEEAHFRRPMMPVNAAVWLGLKAQTALMMWDVAFGCWAACGACWVPGMVCVGVCVVKEVGEAQVLRVLREVGVRSCGFGREAEEFNF